MTVYIKNNYRGKGIGAKLYKIIEDILKKQRIVKTMVHVCYPSDEYSDFGSMQFHESLGYKVAGRIDNCGYKFNRWYSMVIMDKQISETRNVMKVLDFDKVRSKFGL